MIRGFTAIHPFVLLVFYILAITFIMYYQEIVFLVIVGSVIVIINLFLDLGVRLKKWLKALLFMGIFIIIFTPVFNHIGTTVLFYLFSWTITLEAVLQGVVFAITLFNIISLFITFNLTLTNDKLLFLFGRVFPKWALLTMLSIRFIPLLKDRLTEIEAVQRFKHGKMAKPSFKQRLKNGMAQIQILLSWSLEESIQTADSMDARGYGLGKRSKYHRYRMHVRDGIILIILLIIFSLFIISIYSSSPLKILDMTGFERVLKALIIMLFCLPIVLEGKEVVKWRYYLSKM